MQTAAKMRRTSAAPQRWVVPATWTLPAMSYPTARKAAHSSTVAMSASIEILADAGSAPKPRVSTPNIVAKMMVTVPKNLCSSGSVWGPHVSHDLIDRSCRVGCVNQQGTH